MENIIIESMKGNEKHPDVRISIIERIQNGSVSVSTVTCEGLFFFDCEQSGRAMVIEPKDTKLTSNKMMNSSVCGRYDEK